MPVDWYVEFDGAVVGPISSSPLRRLAADGSISPDTRILRGTDGKLLLARQIDGLLPTELTNSWFR